MKAVLVMSAVASVLYGYGSYQLFTVLGCWNRCESLFESLMSLVVFGPLILGPVLCSFASIVCYLRNGVVNTYLLLGAALGGAIAIYYAGWLISGSALAGLDVFLVSGLGALIGVSMILPLLCRAVFVIRKG